MTFDVFNLLVLKCVCVLISELLQEAQGKPFSVHPTVAAEIIHNLHEYNQGKLWPVCLWQDSPVIQDYELIWCIVSYISLSFMDFYTTVSNLNISRLRQMHCIVIIKPAVKGNNILVIVGHWVYFHSDSHTNNTTHAQQQRERITLIGQNKITTTDNRSGPITVECVSACHGIACGVNAQGRELLGWKAHETCTPYSLSLLTTGKKRASTLQTLYN